jgi:predicted transcriptional regulator of viral defense system
VAEKAAGEWGVLSVAELRACGLSKDGIARRVRNGRLHRVHLGVYAVGHTGLTMRGRFLAAVKACGEGAVLSHFSAAALWDLLAYDPARAQT